MPEMKHNFQRGRMNKDLDERLVPDGEYRDALNIEVSTSNDSNLGTVQTLKGNLFLPGQLQSGTCIGSIANDRVNKLYFMVAGDTRDVIVEYDYDTETFLPVCVDNHAQQGVRALNFNSDFLITGINIIEDLLFWTDNNSEPKRINITRGKAGSSNWTTHTSLMVTDTSINAAPNALINTGKPIEEQHLTVIKKGPPAAPVLEMVDTSFGDEDGDGDIGGDELNRECQLGSGANNNWLDISTGDFSDQIVISVVGDLDGDTGYQAGTDFVTGDYIVVYAWEDTNVKVRLKIIGGGSIGYTCKILSGDIEITDYERLMVKLEQKDPLFHFKFVRFAYRYKYEDGEYSAFSPFTQPAFLPGKFNYVPKEGYNLGMFNNVRKLAVKDFVHDRQITDDVVAVDILYKESNSPNVYSVKTIKKRDYNQNKWDEWNGISSVQLLNPSNTSYWNNTKGRVKGFVEITSELIHASVPSNQLLRSYDNVPRKALAQEVIGNRLVYGNYLQNYNFQNSINSHIKVDIQTTLHSATVGIYSPQEIPVGLLSHMQYNPAKSIKSLRTYQVGVVYLDEYGRETPVFSEDKQGVSSGSGITTQSSIYVEKEKAPKRNSLQVTMRNNPPSWATHMKFFIKETSNEYYNLCMDRWYDAEDGNIWLSFPSADRNKVDEETFLVLKKEHDNSEFVHEPGRYKIIAIENEAPRFIKLQNISMGSIVDFLDNSDATDAFYQLGPNANGFPGAQGTSLHSFQVNVHKKAFEAAGWKESLINQDISQCFFRIVGGGVGTSKYYRVQQITWDGGDGTYVIKAGKQFGGDMAFTSTDGTYFNRLTNLELQVIKKIPEDRAEFDGRFFVKILKDGTLIDRLGISSTVQDNLVVTSSMRVQYINPITSKQASGGWHGYGTDPYEISVDSRTGSHSFRPSGYNGGDGDKFWKMAGDDEDASSTSASSGWFIDKVEAFVPFNQINEWVAPDREWTKVYWDAASSCDEAYGDCMYSSSWNNPIKRLLKATGIGTYGSGGSNYLDMGIKGPPSSFKEDHLISKSLGIDKSIGLIHLSYAGLNTSASGGSYAGAEDYMNDDWDFKQGSKHSLDLAFIDKIREAGTIWRWKEDPGKVVYKTIVGTADNQASYYTAAMMGREKMDRDGGWGVFLYNYACFNDYIVTDHHKHSAPKPFPLSGSFVYRKTDFGSREIEDERHSWYDATWIWGLLSLRDHDGHPGADKWKADLGWFGDWSKHNKFPIGIHNWKTCYNRRRRFAIFVQVLETGGEIGSVGPHYYSPSNDPTLPPHFDVNANPITAFPTGHALAGQTFESQGSIAPGIRPDGMYSGYNNHPGGPYTFDKGDGNGAQSIDQIPEFKRWDANHATNNMAPRQSGEPGSVTFEVLEHFQEDSEKFTSTNPAIWETEPKEDVGLDIYHEVGQIYPIYLNNNTIEQFVGPVHIDISQNSYVQCWDPPYYPGGGTGTISLSVNNIKDVRVLAAKDNYVRLGAVQSGTWIAQELPMDITGNGYLHVGPTVGSYLIFHRADGGRTEAHVGPNTYTVPGEGTWFELVGIPGEVGVHSKQIRLPWYNCYSFGNGVESDRIRDDFNQVTIDNGPKASTTLEQPYLEERRTNGFIWSGLYNSTSGVNDLNQFIAAEKITKDTNPSYGSIQKLHARDSDLVAFCEDRVLKVLANKDALFNADGNQNLVSTNRVLGNIRPFIGDYGISLNPESFASDSHRAYFADSSRGAILRLSQDGITAISEAGMDDFFSDHLAKTENYNIIGSFDDDKGEYNITLESILYNHEAPIGPCGTNTSTVSTTTTTVLNDGPTPTPGNPLGDYQRYGGSVDAWATYMESGGTCTNWWINQSTGVGQCMQNIGLAAIPQNTIGSGSAGSSNFFNNQRGWTGIQGGSTHPIGVEHGQQGLIANQGLTNPITLWFNKITCGHGAAPAIDATPNFDALILALNNNGPGNVYLYQTHRNANYSAYASSWAGYTQNWPNNWIHAHQPETIYSIQSISYDATTEAYELVVDWLVGYSGFSDFNTFVWSLEGPGGGGDTSSTATVQNILSDVNYTLSFSERSKGWVSFKSWNHENGISLNNSYYTFKNGMMYQHHINETHNNFYGNQFESSIDVLLNKAPGSVKSYSTFNYEGSQARITPGINNNPDYYDNLPKDGWYIDNAYSDAQELGNLEFWDKENKWFAQVKGVTTQWLNDGTAGNIDPREFSFQGIGNSYSVSCPKCPTVSTWDCVVGNNGCECESVAGSGGQFATLEECRCSTTCCGEDYTQPSYTCDGQGFCTDPGDGSGQYSTYCDCVENSMCCNEGVAYTYGCGSNLTQPSSYIFGCMDDGLTTDPFITQQRPFGWVGPATTYNSNANVHSCDCNYNTAQSWDCIKGDCIEIFNGTGQYPSLLDCTNDCGIDINPCDNQNMGLDTLIVNPTAIGGGDMPCSQTASDGSVSIMVTNQNSTSPTPFTHWTMEIYDSDWSSGSPTVGNLVYADPSTYTVGSWSNVYVGLTTIPAGSTGFNIYYIKVTDNNGCDYGPFTIRINCNDTAIDPCDSYPGDMNFTYQGHSGTCCGRCNTILNSPYGSLHPCYDFCEEWIGCCESVYTPDPCECDLDNHPMGATPWDPVTSQYLSYMVGYVVGWQGNFYHMLSTGLNIAPDQAGSKWQLCTSTCGVYNPNALDPTDPYNPTGVGMNLTDLVLTGDGTTNVTPADGDPAIDNILTFDDLLGVGNTDPCNGLPSGTINAWSTYTVGAPFNYSVNCEFNTELTYLPPLSYNNGHDYGEILKWLSKLSNGWTSVDTRTTRQCLKSNFTHLQSLQGLIDGDHCPCTTSDGLQGSWYTEFTFRHSRDFFINSNGAWEAQNTITEWSWQDFVNACLATGDPIYTGMAVGLDWDQTHALWNQNWLNLGSPQSYVGPFTPGMVKPMDKGMSHCHCETCP